MPLAVERLTDQSTLADARGAVDDSIAQCIREGKSQKECAGMAFSMARERCNPEVAASLGQEGRR